jgi:hypothetical protein
VFLRYLNKFCGNLFKQPVKNCRALSVWHYAKKKTRNQSLELCMWREKSVCINSQLQPKFTWGDYLDFTSRSLEKQFKTDSRASESGLFGASHSLYLAFKSVKIKWEKLVARIWKKSTDMKFQKAKTSFTSIFERKIVRNFVLTKIERINFNDEMTPNRVQFMQMKLKEINYKLE